MMMMMNTLLIPRRTNFTPLTPLPSVLLCTTPLLAQPAKRALLASNRVVRSPHRFALRVAPLYKTRLGNLKCLFVDSSFRYSNLSFHTISAFFFCCLAFVMRSACACPSKKSHRRQQFHHHHHHRARRCHFRQGRDFDLGDTTSTASQGSIVALAQFS